MIAEGHLFPQYRDSPAPEREILCNYSEKWKFKMKVYERNSLRNQKGEIVT